MPSETNVGNPETDTVQNNGDASADKNKNGKQKRKRSKNKPIGTPLLIAAIIFIATLIFFGVWKCFFDTGIIGSWTFKIDQTERKYTYNFTFEDDNVMRFNYGGRTFIGKYNFVDKAPQIHIYASNLGQTFIDAYFDYEISGNIFTGKHLTLTDRTGLIFPPDEINSETDEQDLVKLKKKFAKSSEEDGIRYYKLTFENYGTEPEIKKYDDFKADDKLVGTWLYKDEATGYSYTFTFSKDGVLEQLSSEMDMIGGYNPKDGKCTYNFVAAGGTTADFDFKYSVNGKTLTIDDDFKLTKTDDKYAYKSEIK